VRAYVGVTDSGWYRFLIARPQLQEANIWQPSGGREFRVVGPGEPFFFKTYYPQNRVIGGSLFSSPARLTVSEAWGLVGEVNGAESIEEMRDRISRCRRTPIGAGEDPVIGCLFVRDVRFFADDAITAAPPRFAQSIVQGKSYDLQRLARRSPPQLDLPRRRLAHFQRSKSACR
jgi:putative restriction endonuclease